MNGEQRGHESALPKRAGHLIEHEKEKEHGHRMKQHIGKVMPSRLQSVYLAIEHMRYSRQRMPVSCVSVGKCVDEAIGGEGPWNLRGFLHAHAIITNCANVPQSLTKNEPSDCNRSEAGIKRRESPQRALFKGIVG